VADAVRIAVQSDHQHVDRPRCTVGAGRDDVIDVQVLHTLADPADVLAAAGSAAGGLRQPLAALHLVPDNAILRGSEEPVGREEIGVVVAVVRAGIDGARVLRDELPDLEVVEGGQRRRRCAALPGGSKAGQCEHRHEDCDCRSAVAHVARLEFRTRQEDAGSENQDPALRSRP
jgi:hypothetical protein